MVAHEILVSALGPLVFGIWVWGLGVMGPGLDNIMYGSREGPRKLGLGMTIIDLIFVGKEWIFCLFY